MDSTRQLKYNRLLQKEMGELFSKEGRNFYGNAFVTVTNVRVSPDLGIANIQISIFGVKDTNATLEQIRSHTREIRHLLGNSIRHQARIIPELKFFLDDSLDYVEKMEKLFKDINTPPPAPSEE
jgi:ribosome-binding factor A